uniref:Secreted protein n=1 Tax=Seriola lalandi dorsalis TaxID=1841481 RepID=A0A3B4XDG4_SERLL
MSLIVTLFVMTLVTQCWTAPQRRNWTPQAMLYLKGARKNTFRAVKNWLVLSHSEETVLYVDLFQRDTAQCWSAPAERKMTLYI